MVVPLKDLQKLHYPAGTQGPSSALEALQHLLGNVQKALDYLQYGNTPQAQVLLENSLTLLMTAFHYLNLDLEQVVKREQIRHPKEVNNLPERLILVFSDHAELRVGGELRGTIPLYTPEDYRELQDIARLFQCRVEHAHHVQLSLFSNQVAR